MLLPVPRRARESSRRRKIKALSSRNRKRDPYTTLDYLERYTAQVEKVGLEVPEINNVFLLNGIGGTSSATTTNTAIAFFVLDPWNQRERSTAEVLAEARAARSREDRRRASQRVHDAAIADSRGLLCRSSS